MSLPSPDATLPSLLRATSPSLRCHFPQASDHLLGIKEPKNLTGQVTLDENVEEFRGNYSRVALGRYQNRRVAAKIIQRTGELESMKRKVKRETMIWATTEHPNILPFYGFADDDAFAPFGALISPWCQKGDASRYLSEHGETMSFNDRINLWEGTIRGVVYLHEHEPTIIHGDLKPGNVLIDDSGTPRICDFGLAQIFVNTGHTDMTTTSEHTGTARYLAPELVASNESVYPTSASDVYALGCLGLEFIFLQKPHANRANNVRGQIYVDLRKGRPPASFRPQGEWASSRVWPLLQAMWISDPNCRPPAFLAERMLGCLNFTLPLNAVHIIIDHVATEYGHETEEQEWTESRDLLRNFCVVSKPFRAYALPLLYEKVRLRLRGGSTALENLISTLVSRKFPVIPLNPTTADGYKISTKLLILELETSEDYYIFSPEVPVQIRDLLQMMPALQNIRICAQWVPEPAIGTHGLTTLEIRGPYAERLLSLDSTLQALAFFQRLYIHGSGEQSHSALPTPPLQKPVFPFLREITMTPHYPGDLDVEGALAHMSNWIMPRLQYLFLNSKKISTEEETSVIAFLQVHGNCLRHLSLPAATPSALSNVLHSCNCIQHLVITCIDFRFLGQVPRHTTLETILVKDVLDNYVDATKFSSYVEAIADFRSNSRVLHPKLEAATFTWSHMKRGTPTTASATFRDENSPVSVFGYSRSGRFDRKHVAFEFCDDGKNDNALETPLVVPPEPVQEPSFSSTSGGVALDAAGISRSSSLRISFPFGWSKSSKERKEEQKISASYDRTTNTGDAEHPFPLVREGSSGSQYEAPPVRQLLKLGFDRDRSIRALEKSNYNFKRAHKLLLTPSVDHLRNQQLPDLGPAEIPTLKLLVEELGFDPKKALIAWESSNYNFKRTLDGLIHSARAGKGYLGDQYEIPQVQNQDSRVLSIKQLRNFGFTRDKAKSALANSNYNVHRALDGLLLAAEAGYKYVGNEVEVPDLLTPEIPALQQLIELGFDQAGALRALQNSNYDFGQALEELMATTEA